MPLQEHTPKPSIPNSPSPLQETKRLSQRYKSLQSIKKKFHSSHISFVFSFNPLLHPTLFSHVLRFPDPASFKSNQSTQWKTFYGGRITRQTAANMKRTRGDNAPASYLNERLGWTDPVTHQFHNPINTLIEEQLRTTFISKVGTILGPSLWSTMERFLNLQNCQSQTNILVQPPGPLDWSLSSFPVLDALAPNVNAMKMDDIIELYRPLFDLQIAQSTQQKNEQLAAFQQELQMSDHYNNEQKEKLFQNKVVEIDVQTTQHLYHEALQHVSHYYIEQFANNLTQYYQSLPFPELLQPLPSHLQLLFDPSAETITNTAARAIPPSQHSHTATKTPSSFYHTLITSTPHTISHFIFTYAYILNTLYNYPSQTHHLPGEIQQKIDQKNNARSTVGTTARGLPKDQEQEQVVTRTTAPTAPTGLNLLSYFQLDRKKSSAFNSKQTHYDNTSLSHTYNGQYEYNEFVYVTVDPDTFKIVLVGKTKPIIDSLLSPSSSATSTGTSVTRTQSATHNNSKTGDKKPLEIGCRVLQISTYGYYIRIDVASHETVDIYPQASTAFPQWVCIHPQGPIAAYYESNRFFVWKLSTMFSSLFQNITPSSTSLTFSLQQPGTSKQSSAHQHQYHQNLQHQQKQPIYPLFPNTYSTSTTLTIFHAIVGEITLAIYKAQKYTYNIPPAAVFQGLYSHTSWTYAFAYSNTRFHSRPLSLVPPAKLTQFQLNNHLLGLRDFILKQHLENEFLNFSSSQPQISSSQACHLTILPPFQNKCAIENELKKNPTFDPNISILHLLPPISSQIQHNVALFGVGRYNSSVWELPISTLTFLQSPNNSYNITIKKQFTTFLAKLFTENMQPFYNAIFHPYPHFAEYIPHIQPTNISNFIIDTSTNTYATTLHTSQSTLESLSTQLITLANKQLRSKKLLSTYFDQTYARSKQLLQYPQYEHNVALLGALMFDSLIPNKLTQTQFHTLIIQPQASDEPVVYQNVLHEHLQSVSTLIPSHLAPTILNTTIPSLPVQTIQCLDNALAQLQPPPQSPPEQIKHTKTKVRKIIDSQQEDNPTSSIQQSTLESLESRRSAFREQIQLPQSVASYCFTRNNNNNSVSHLLTQTQSRQILHHTLQHSGISLVPSQNIFSQSKKIIPYNFLFTLPLSQINFTLTPLTYLSFYRNTIQLSSFPPRTTNPTLWTPSNPRLSTDHFTNHDVLPLSLPKTSSDALTPLVNSSHHALERIDSFLNNCSPQHLQNIITSELNALIQQCDSLFSQQKDPLISLPQPLQQPRTHQPTIKLTSFSFPRQNLITDITPINTINTTTPLLLPRAEFEQLLQSRNSSAQGAALLSTFQYPSLPHIAPLSNSETVDETPYRQWLLKQHGLAVFEEVGDGNCLFRTISRQLFGHDAFYIMLRSLVVVQLTFYQDLYSVFVIDPLDIHLFQIGHDREWGDNLELKAISDLFGVNIQVFSPQMYNEIQMGNDSQGYVEIEPNQEQMPCESNLDHFDIYMNQIFPLQQRKSFQNLINKINRSSNANHDQDRDTLIEFDDIDEIEELPISQQHSKFLKYVTSLRQLIQSDNVKQHPQQPIIVSFQGSNHYNSLYKPSQDNSTIQFTPLLKPAGLLALCSEYIPWLHSLFSFYSSQIFHKLALKKTHQLCPYSPTIPSELVLSLSDRLQLLITNSEHEELFTECCIMYNKNERKLNYDFLKHNLENIAQLNTLESEPNFAVDDFSELSSTVVQANFQLFPLQPSTLQLAQLVNDQQVIRLDYLLRQASQWVSSNQEAINELVNVLVTINIDLYCTDTIGTYADQSSNERVNI